MVTLRYLTTRGNTNQYLRVGTGEQQSRRAHATLIYKHQYSLIEQSNTLLMQLDYSNIS